MGLAMAVSPTLKGLFAFLLAVSVGGKIIAVSWSPAEGTWSAPYSAGNTEIAAFFDRHEFLARKDENNMGDVFVGPGVAGDCHLLVINATPEGWVRDAVRQLASRNDEVFFVFDGTVYQDQPTWHTRMHYYWRQLNRFTGRAIPARPVLGIVASPGCDLRDMPWREIAELR